MIVISIVHFFLFKEHFCTISLTENQLNDIARRDKLQRLRDQEDHVNRNNQSPLITILTSPHEPSSLLSSTTLSSTQSNKIEEERLINEDAPSAPDLLKDHIDGEHVHRQKMV